MDLRLVLFDVDGTLVDSQHAIVGAAHRGADAVGLPRAPREAVLGIVGLSLPDAVAVLYPDAVPELQARMVAAYKQAYFDGRAEAEQPPLFPGADQTMRALHARDEVLLGTATGMSRRGMNSVERIYGLKGLFATTQTADENPSKPNPAMVLAALADTGVDAGNAVFVGDTVYDMEAGRAAGVACVGVSWGYHSADDLTAAGADYVIDGFDALIPLLDDIWSKT